MKIRRLKTLFRRKTQNWALLNQRRPKVVAVDASEARKSVAVEVVKSYLVAYFELIFN